MGTHLHSSLLASLNTPHLTLLAAAGSFLFTGRGCSFPAPSTLVTEGDRDEGTVFFDCRQSF